jgi:hypothetical protein
LSGASTARSRPTSTWRTCARIAEVAAREVGEFFIDDHMRNIPDHWHAHARPKGGFFGPRSALA